MPSCKFHVLVLVGVLVVVDVVLVDTTVLSESSDRGLGVVAELVKVMYVVMVLVLVDSPALVDAESKLPLPEVVDKDEEDSWTTTGTILVAVVVGLKSSCPSVLASACTGNVVGAATMTENSLSATPSTSSRMYLARLSPRGSFTPARFAAPGDDDPRFFSRP